MQRRVIMEDTQDLHNPTIREDTMRFVSYTTSHLDQIAYRCLGVAQAVRDLSFMRDPESFEKSRARLIELATEFDNLRRKYDEQSTKH